MQAGSPGDGSIAGMDARPDNHPDLDASSAEPPFHQIADDPPPTPLVFASPHSGRHYPAAMLEASAVR